MAEGRPVSGSKTVMARTMLPSDANPYGNVHGGEVMRLIDDCAGAAAIRHARARVVTAFVDELSFLAPVYVGNFVTAKASVNHVGRTSMEVGVRVEAEDLETGTVVHVSSAYLVFVAIDAAGKPIVAYKLGRSAEARELAVTHSGALAGEDDVAEAFLSACGIARVDTFEGLIEALPLLRRVPPRANKRTPTVGVVTTTGGAAAT